MQSSDDDLALHWDRCVQSFSKVHRDDEVLVLAVSSGNEAPGTWCGAAFVVDQDKIQRFQNDAGNLETSNHIRIVIGANTEDDAKGACKRAAMRWLAGIPLEHCGEVGPKQGGGRRARRRSEA